MEKAQVIQKVTQLLQQSEERQVEALLQSATNGALEQVRKNLQVSVEEATSPAVQEFITNCGDRLVDVTTSWVNEQSKKLIVFPTGTRFVQRDDKTTHIVVEEAPRLRRIAFNDRRGGGGLRHYYVSLPYVQYVITFTKSGRSERFHKLKICCSKTPIESLTDLVYDLPLPNIGMSNRFGVCTGREQGGMELPEGSDAFTEKCNTLITSFWASEFNTDLSSNLLLFFQKNFGYDQLTESDINVRIHACFQKWEELSRSTPLFVLGPDMKFPQDVGTQLGRLIESDLTSRGSKSALTRNMKQMVTEGLFQLSDRTTQVLRESDLEEHNRLAYHRQNIARAYNYNLSQGYDLLYREMFTNLDEEKQKALQDVLKEKKELAKDREQFNAAKLKTQIELQAAHQFLLAEQAKVAELKAKAEEIIARGAPVPEVTASVPKRGRGRPRKPVPPPQLDANGQPIKRGRGRPRKNPVVETPVVSSPVAETRPQSFWQQQRPMPFTSVYRRD